VYNTPLKSFLIPDNSKQNMLKGTNKIEGFKNASRNRSEAMIEACNIISAICIVHMTFWCTARNLQEYKNSDVENVDFQDCDRQNVWNEKREECEEKRCDSRSYCERQSHFPAHLQGNFFYKN
jgi:hypothetical protein